MLDIQITFKTHYFIWFETIIVMIARLIFIICSDLMFYITGSADRVYGRLQPFYLPNIAAFSTLLFSFLSLFFALSVLFGTNIGCFFGTNIGTCVLYTGAYYTPRNTVDLLICAYLDCHEFLILRLFTKFIIREFTFFFSKMK